MLADLVHCLCRVLQSFLYITSLRHKDFGKVGCYCKSSFFFSYDWKPPHGPRFPFQHPRTHTTHTTQLKYDAKCTKQMVTN